MIPKYMKNPSETKLSAKKVVGKYLLDKPIGKGSYAQVWQGRIQESEEVVAVKVISRSTIGETFQLKQEVAVLKKIEHENIVRFKDLKKSAGHFYLILEFCPGGDLARFILSRKKVSESVAKRFLHHISSGLIVIHKHNFIHRDLKPQNILLSDDSDDAVLKIADFGFARSLLPFDMAATICGSPLYMAPEILRHERYDGRADIWSVGAIIYELVYGKTPFSGSNPMQLLSVIEKTDPSNILKVGDNMELSNDLTGLLSVVLVKNPNDRISCFKFFNHPYNGVSSCTLEKAGNSEEKFPGLPSNDENNINCLKIQEPEQPEISRSEEQGKKVEETIPSSNMNIFLDETSILHFVNEGVLVGSYCGCVCALARLFRILAMKNHQEGAVIMLLMKALEILDAAIEDTSSSDVQRVLRKEFLECIDFTRTILLQMHAGDVQDMQMNKVGYMKLLFTCVSEQVREAAAEYHLSGRHASIARLKVAILVIDFLVKETRNRSRESGFEEDFDHLVHYQQRIRDLIYLLTCER